MQAEEGVPDERRGNQPGRADGHPFGTGGGGGDMHAACALTVTAFAQRILPKMGAGLTPLLPNSAPAASEEEEGFSAYPQSLCAPVFPARSVCYFR